MLYRIFLEFENQEIKNKYSEIFQNLFKNEYWDYIKFIPENDLYLFLKNEYFNVIRKIELDFSNSKTEKYFIFFSYEGVGNRESSSINLAKGNETGLLDLRDETSEVQPSIVSGLNEYRIYHFHDTGKTARVKQSFNLYDNEFLYEDARNLASFLYKLQETNKIALEIILTYKKIYSIIIMKE